MRRKPGILVCAAVVLAASLCAAATPAAAVKGSKKSTTAKATTVVNGIVPHEISGPPEVEGLLTSTARLGKKFKGRQIADVNLIANGSASGAGASVGSMDVSLTAPNGDKVQLFASLNGMTFGPLTLDDESPLGLNTFPADSFQDPGGLLSAPYLGTASPFDRLSHLDNGPANGTWTLTVLNANSNTTRFQIFGTWILVVKTRPPLATR